ncbi:MAG TPA: hypothetical protein VHB99_00820, partial [Pirellulales bacterium]|nr:hypothetical protein [Pirellulales bacterium]
MRPLRRASLFFCCLAWVMHAAIPVQGESAEGPPPSAPAVAASASSTLPEVTPELLQSRITQIKASKDLDDDAKTAILGMYQNAQAELDRAAALLTQTAQFKKAAQNAPQALRNMLAELDKPPEPQRPEAPGDATMTELETRLAEAQDKLNQAQSELTRIEAEPQRRNERRLKSIPEQVDAANKKLEEIQKQATATAPADEAKEMTAARQALLAARALALNQEIACSTNERESYNAEDDLLPKQHDLAQRKVATCKQSVDFWQKLVHAGRQREADAKLKSAKQEKQKAYPELRG